MAEIGIILRAEYGRCHWTVYDDGKMEWRPIPFVARLGYLEVDNFRGYRIVEITSNRIVIACGDEVHILRPGETLEISREVDGREWSDGCVYDGNTYNLKITWL